MSGKRNICAIWSANKSCLDDDSAARIPLLILLLIRSRERKRDRVTRKDPFPQPLLRPPGESVRLKVRELNEEFDELVTPFVIMPIVVALIGLLSFERLGQSYPIVPIFVGSIIGLAIVMIYIGRKMLRVGKDLRDYELGIQGNGTRIRGWIESIFTFLCEIPVIVERASCLFSGNAIGRGLLGKSATGKMPVLR